jgi:hypothetical protein
MCRSPLEILDEIEGHQGHVNKLDANERDDDATETIDEQVIP